MNNLFYAPDLQNQNQFYVFDKSESRHISRVLRKNIADSIFITNGKGDLFETHIVENNPNKTRVEIVQYKHVQPSETKLHIGIAPTKSNERIEWFLEKATEIGVDEITPLLTQYSERKKINIERYERVIISAMKQSLQVFKPHLNPLTPLKDFVQNTHSEQKLIAWCKSPKKIKDVLQPQISTVFLVGPEGGFSPEELKMAFHHQYQPTLLSHNRLRTETAGIVAVSVFNEHNL